MYCRVIISFDECFEWIQCNVECGNGFQYRQIRCQNHYGETLPDEECIDEQPKHVRRCQKESCKSNPKHTRENNLESNIVRRWKMSNWTPVSNIIHQCYKIKTTQSKVFLQFSNIQYSEANRADNETLSFGIKM